jgi:CBS-domain-containing membrane protein
LLDEHRVRHLPVVEHGRLVGVVSDRDLLERATAPSRREARSAPTVRDRMSASVETVNVDEPLTRACRRMLERRVSCLPAMQGSRIAGILTELDLMRVYERVCRYSGHDAAVDTVIGARASGELVVVSPDDTAVDALDRCRAKGVRHLPVVRDGWVVGVVSDRDLLPAAGAPESGASPVGDLMSRDFVALEPGAPLSAAAERMVANGLHCLPVLDQGALRGIVTSADVLAALCAIDERALASAWASEVALGAGVEES